LFEANWLISDIKGGTLTKGGSEQGAEETFGPKRDEVTGGWRKLHNEKVYNLYSSSSLIGDLIDNLIKFMNSRRVVETGHVAQMGKKKNVYRGLIGKPEIKRPLGRQKNRSADNIKIDLTEI
jgi:hypothetical protein